MVTQAERAAVATLSSETALERRIETAFRLTLGRFPTSAESESVVQFILQNTDVDLTERWTQVFHSLFASMDFRYIK